MPRFITEKRRLRAENEVLRQELEDQQHMRLRHYHDGYKQGRFDEKMEQLYMRRSGE